MDQERQHNVGNGKREKEEGRVPISITDTSPLIYETAQTWMKRTSGSVLKIGIDERLSTHKLSSRGGEGGVRDSLDGSAGRLSPLGERHESQVYGQNEYQMNGPH